jgi:hypothetical protein
MKFLEFLCHAPVPIKQSHYRVLLTNWQLDVSGRSRRVATSRLSFVLRFAIMTPIPSWHQRFPTSLSRPPRLTDQAHTQGRNQARRLASSIALGEMSRLARHAEARSTAKTLASLACFSSSEPDLLTFRRTSAALPSSNRPTHAEYLTPPISNVVISAARRLGNRRRRTAQGSGSGAALAEAPGSVSVP